MTVDRAVTMPDADPDFTIFFTQDVLADPGPTGTANNVALKALDPIEGQAPVVEGYGSSVLKDSDRDVFLPECMEYICQKAAPGMNTWIEHQWTMDKLFGGLTRFPELTIIAAGSRGNETGADVAGVRIWSDVELESPAAERALKFMRKGRQFGWSGGFLYEDYEPIKDGRGRTQGVKVRKARPIEFSVVPIPANPVSWITACTKSMRQKGLLDDDLGETAYRIKHFRDFPDTDQVALLKLQDWLIARYGDVCLAKLPGQAERVMPEAA